MIKRGSSSGKRGNGVNGDKSEEAVKMVIESEKIVVGAAKPRKGIGNQGK
jgi:hypothetical protein